MDSALETEKRNLSYYDAAYSDIPQIRKTYEARLFSRNILSLKELQQVEGADYLEIGFGTGLTFEGFWNRGVSSATGIELSSKAIQFLQEGLGGNQNGKQLRLIQGSVEESIDKIGEQRFDLIVMSNIIEHVQQDGLLLKSLYNALKPEGRLCMTYPTPSTIEDPSHFRTYSPESMSALILQTLKEPKILRNEYISPCLMGWVYSHVLPLFLKTLRLNQSSNESEIPIKEQKRNDYFTFLRSVYHKFLVPIMIGMAPADEFLGKLIGYGNQGVVLVQRKSSRFQMQDN